MAARIAASKLKGDIRFVGGRFSIGMGGSVGIGRRQPLTLAIPTLGSTLGQLRQQRAR